MHFASYDCQIALVGRNQIQYFAQRGETFVNKILPISILTAKLMRRRSPVNPSEALFMLILLLRWLGRFS